MRKLVITLIVLAAVFVVADRLTHSAAQRQVAREIAETYELSSRPEVRIRGFPFLTQAVRGHYREIDLATEDVAVSDVRIGRIEVRLASVEAPLQALLQRDVSEVRAGTVTGTAVVSFAEVQRRLPGETEVRPAGDALELSGDVRVFGRAVPVTAVLDVAVADGAIALRPTRIEAGGVAGNPALQERFTFRIPIEGLPLQLRPTGVEVTGDGVRVSATAEDVALTQVTG